MIGLSVSICISNILEGWVGIQEVEKIVGSTKVTSPEGWEPVIARYKKKNWFRNPDRGEKIFRQLLAEGKIIQPRLTENRCPISGEIQWVENESEIRYRPEVD